MKIDPRRKKQIGIGGVSLLVVLLLVYGFWPETIVVDTARVSRGAMELTIEEEGKTQLRDRYILSAPVSGVLQRIGRETGDLLNEGDVVARLVPATPEMLNEQQYAIQSARLNAARTALEQAREQLRLAEEEAVFAEKELKRIRDLHEKEIGSDQDLERAEMAQRRAATAKASADFGLRIARYELESAEAAVEWSRSGSTSGKNMEVRAPVDGYLLQIPNRSERPVMTGEAIAEIGNLESLEIRVDLLSSDAVRIEPGTRVRIKRWGGDEILEGSVRLVEPSGYTRISALGVEEQRVPVKIDLVSDEQQWRRLGDGYRIVADFILWQGEDVLRVPTSALFRISGEWALFTYEDGEAIQKKVTIGNQSGLFTEITGGLNEGETVLTHPDERIEEGVRITPRE